MQKYEFILYVIKCISTSQFMYNIFKFLFIIINKFIYKYCKY
jgi:hypothetical protein